MTENQPVGPEIETVVQVFRLSANGVFVMLAPPLLLGWLLVEKVPQTSPLYFYIVSCMVHCII